MKRTKRLLIGLVVNIVWGSCWVSSANAGVITMGTWLQMNQGGGASTTMNAVDAYWNNPSWDGPGLNAGQLINSWGWPVEYLSGGSGAVAFAFDQSEFFWEATSITAWMDGRGIWQLPDGSVNFATHGFIYNTLTTPQQFALFRYVGPTQIIYFLGVEDIPVAFGGDRDYNDYIGYSYERVPPISTPEPATLALMLSGGLVIWGRRRSAAR